MTRAQQALRAQPLGYEDERPAPPRMPTVTSADAILALQRGAGNALVCRHLAGARTVARMPGLGFAPAPPVGMPGLPPPGAMPPPLPGAVGLGWQGSAGLTAEVAGGELLAGGTATVVEGTVVAGGATLGEGAVALGAGLTAEGAAALGTGVVVGEVAVDATLVTAGTIATTEALAGAGAGAGTGAVVGGAGLLTPVGWIVIGVVVVVVGTAAVVYLLTREAEPVEAPGTDGSAVEEPDVAAPVMAPGKGSMAPVREPERPAPAVAPGAPGSGPLEAAKIPFTRDQFTARKAVYPIANSWDLEFWALLPDQDVQIGFANVSLAEDGLPNDPNGPNMYINKDHVLYQGQDRALETDGFALTTAALEEMIRLYREDFGEDPPALGGTLTMKNLLYFQQQYAIARDANPMGENEEWELAAIRATPFGANRIPLGYTEFKVEPGPNAEVDLGTTREGVSLGRRYVPSTVKVRAWLP